MSNRFLSIYELNKYRNYRYKFADLIQILKNDFNYTYSINKYYYVLTELIETFTSIFEKQYLFLNEYHIKVFNEDLFYPSLIDNYSLRLEEYLDDICEILILKENKSQDKIKFIRLVYFDRTRKPVQCFKNEVLLEIFLFKYWNELLYIFYNDIKKIENGIITVLRKKSSYYEEMKLALDQFIKDNRKKIEGNILNRYSYENAFRIGKLEGVPDSGNSIYRTFVKLAKIYINYYQFFENEKLEEKIVNEVISKSPIIIKLKE